MAARYIQLHKYGPLHQLHGDLISSNLSSRHANVSVIGEHQHLAMYEARKCSLDPLA